MKKVFYLFHYFLLPISSQNIEMKSIDTINKTKNKQSVNELLNFFRFLSMLRHMCLMEKFDPRNWVIRVFFVFVFSDKKQLQNCR